MQFAVTMNCCWPIRLIICGREIWIAFNWIIALNVNWQSILCQLVHCSDEVNRWFHHQCKRSHFVNIFIIIYHAMGPLFGGIFGEWTIFVSIQIYWLFHLTLFCSDIPSFCVCQNENRKPLSAEGHDVLYFSRRPVVQIMFGAKGSVWIVHSEADSAGDHCTRILNYYSPTPNQIVLWNPTEVNEVASMLRFFLHFMKSIIIYLFILLLPVTFGIKIYKMNIKTRYNDQRKLNLFYLNFRPKLQCNLTEWYVTNQLLRGWWSGIHTQTELFRSLRVR